MRMLTPSALVFALATTIFIASACSKKTEERAWRPTDHDQPDEQPPGPVSPPDPVAAPNPVAAVNDIWNGTCAPCHGVGGKGDGPAGRALRAPDLTSAAFQQRTTDDEIATTITNGRGKMPSYQFPPARVQGLVKKVRSLRQ